MLDALLVPIVEFRGTDLAVRRLPDDLIEGPLVGAQRADGIVSKVCLGGIGDICHQLGCDIPVVLNMCRGSGVSRVEISIPIPCVRSRREMFSGSTR